MIFFYYINRKIINIVFNIYIYIKENLGKLFLYLKKKCGKKKSFEFGALRAHTYLFDIDKYEEDNTSYLILSMRKIIRMIKMRMIEDGDNKG